jgi:hypothetical protein
VTGEKAAGMRGRSRRALRYNAYPENCIGILDWIAGTALP